MMESFSGPGLAIPFCVKLSFLMPVSFVPINLLSASIACTHEEGADRSAILAQKLFSVFNDFDKSGTHFVIECCSKIFFQKSILYLVEMDLHVQARYTMTFFDKNCSKTMGHVLFDSDV